MQAHGANPNRKGHELPEKQTKSSFTRQKDGTLVDRDETAEQMWAQGGKDNEQRGPAVLGVLQCSDVANERDDDITKLEWSNWSAEDLLTG